MQSRQLVGFGAQDLIAACRDLQRLGRSRERLLKLLRLFLNRRQRLLECIAFERQGAIASLHFRQPTLVFELLLSEKDFKLRLLLESSRAKGAGLLLEGTLGVERCCARLVESLLHGCARCGLVCEPGLEVRLAVDCGAVFAGCALVHVCHRVHRVGESMLEGVAGGLDIGELGGEGGFALRQTFDVGSSRLLVATDLVEGCVGICDCLFESGARCAFLPDLPFEFRLVRGGVL